MPLHSSTKGMSQIETRSRRRRTAKAANRVQDLSTSVYRPLATERREIRLLELSPGHFQDQIRCSLSTYSLGESPPYEALSYVWGAGGSRRRIFLEGRPRYITRNLQIALRHLRYISRPRILWIDAICINQKDVSERNTQVIHMGHIYKSASRVVAWLGEENEDSELAFDALRALPTDGQLHWDSASSPAFDNIFLETKISTAIGRLLNRAWWHRVWTVQESILAPTLHFVCGDRELPADSLCAIGQSYAKHSRSCCRQFLWKNESTRYNIASFMNRLDDLGRYRRDKGNFHLVKLLVAFRSRCCIDPRDKVYGFLGLCPSSERKELHPDYSVPVPVVYEKAALSIINTTKSLKVFSQVCRFFDSDESLTTGLPSWVPDWTLQLNSRQLTVLAVRYERNDDYMASSRTLASVRYVKPGRIALRGTIIGFVGMLGTPHHEGLSKGSQLKNWRAITGIEALPDRLYSKETSTTYYDAFWQTLCCSILLSRTSLHDPNQVVRTCNDTSYRSWYNAWWTWVSEFDMDPEKIDLVSSEYTGSEIHVFDANVEVSTRMRNLFISTDEEWLGLAPMNAVTGDALVLLEGGPVPYILRPKGDAPAGEYELIGDAYVHGAMDGERWNPDLLQEIVLV